MNPLYIPATNTIIRNYSHRYIHPTTGIVYGSGDYDNAAKLAEIGAVPVLTISDEIPENPIEIASTEGLSEDGNSYVITRHYRSKTEEELATDITQAKTALLNQIYQLYQHAETSNITPVGAIKLSEECALENPRALANRQWFVELYAERDTKLSLVEGGNLEVDPNPSSLQKPYTFREL